MTPYGLLISALLSAGLLAGGTAWHLHKVSEARKEGYAAAVTAGEVQRLADADKALQTERNLRNQLSIKDDAARAEKEKHDEDLADAQRRMRAGTDRLRCPAASTVHAVTTAPAGPTAGGPAPDEPGAAVVPEVAADILGLAADTAELVRKYDRVVDRYDACRALNNGAAPSP